MVFDITGVIVTVVTGLILAVIGNLMTTPVQRWWAERSRRNARHYISNNTKFLKELEEYRTKPITYQTQMVKLMATVFRDLVRFVGFSSIVVFGFWSVITYSKSIDPTLGILVAGGLVFLGFMCPVYFAVLIYDYLKLSRTLDVMRPFDKTEEKIINQLAYLRRKYPDEARRVDHELGIVP